MTYWKVYIKLKLDEMFERRHFHLMDVDGGGCVEWWEFAQHAATSRLARRSQVHDCTAVHNYDVIKQEELVKLLSGKEKMNAKRVFDYLDCGRNGIVKKTATRQTFRSWYQFLEFTVVRKLRPQLSRG